jgi:hypothetical protein
MFALRSDLLGVDTVELHRHGPARLGVAARAASADMRVEVSSILPERLRISCKSV